LKKQTNEMKLNIFMLA